MTPSSRPLAVFDLDDTLVDYAGAIDRWFVATARERGIGERGLAFLRAEQERPVPPEESFRAIVDEFGFPETPAQLEADLHARLPSLVTVHRGALEGLRRLRDAGWLIALVTNGEEDEQRAKMHDGLEKAFDTVCFSGAEGVRKPDRRIFELAARRLRRPLAGAWVVGDSLQSDIGGAANLGLSSIWVSWGRPLPVGAAEPTHIVAHVEEAFARLLALPGEGWR